MATRGWAGEPPNLTFAPERPQWLGGVAEPDSLGSPAGHATRSSTSVPLFYPSGALYCHYVGARHCPLPAQALRSPGSGPRRAHYYFPLPPAQRGLPYDDRGQPHQELPVGFQRHDPAARLVAQLLLARWGNVQGVAERAQLHVQSRSDA